MGKRLAVFLNSFLLLQSFNRFFKRKMGLRVVFVKLTFMWLQTGLSDLKNTKQLKFCLWWIFYAFLKRLHFSKFFEILEINQYFLVKLLNALNFI